MNLKRFANSLATRLVLFGAIVVLASGVARYYVLTDFLHDDLTVMAADQQSIIASYLAQDIDHRVLDRRHFLEQLAAALPPQLISQPDQLRAWLQARQLLQPLFSQGLFVADASGMIVVDYPVTGGRKGLSLAAYPDFGLVKSGRFIIGEPLLSPATRQPILPMMAPVRDGDGKVVAVLGGTTALAAAGFLDHLQQARLGNSGSFILVSPSTRRIIGSNDPTRVFQPLPSVGADPLLDKAVDGFRGHGVGANVSGVEEIKAIAPVPSAGWFVIVQLPVAAALPAVENVQAFILRGGVAQATVIFLLILLTVVWFFQPLRRAADQAERMTRGELPLTPLAVAGDDEVGHLTMAFNRLLSRLKSHQAELQHQAHHDLLTGLPNRVMLAERMPQAIAHARGDRSVALLFLDLDGFKAINDTLGHKVGDQVLREIAQRLLRVARHTDTLARVGGDEFVLLTTDLGTPLEHGLHALAEKCIQTVAEPLPFLPDHCELGVSIGIAVSQGGCDADFLLQAADKAMYRAKNKGRGCYVVAPASESEIDA